MIYHHQQFSMDVAAIALAVFAVVAAILWLARRRAPGAWPIAIMSVTFVVLAAITHVFSSLTIEVGEHELSWYFGPGVYRRHVDLSAITGVKPARIPHWAELGAKCRPANCIYAVAWGGAVKLRLNHGGPIRLGTDDPAGLTAALNARRS